MQFNDENGVDECLNYLGGVKLPDPLSSDLRPATCVDLFVLYLYGEGGARLRARLRLPTRLV
jgi:hypothetical protein